MTALLWEGGSARFSSSKNFFRTPKIDCASPLSVHAPNSGISLRSALPSAGARAGVAVRRALASHLHSIRCTVRGQQCAVARKCAPGGWRSKRTAAAQCTTHCMCFAPVVCVTHRPRLCTSLLDAYHQRIARCPLPAMCAWREIARGGQLRREQKNAAQKGA